MRLEDATYLVQNLFFCNKKPTNAVFSELELLLVG